MGVGADLRDRRHHLRCSPCHEQEEVSQRVERTAPGLVGFAAGSVHLLSHLGDQ